MSRKEVNNEQAKWENEKKHKDALIRRKKVNEAMHWLFTDEATAHGGLGEYEMKKKGLVPTGNFRVETADVTYELPGLGGGGQGWGSSVGLHAIDCCSLLKKLRQAVNQSWDWRQKHCPVVSSRQVLKTGKHMFKIIIKKRPVGEFLASDGLIKVGFYHANLDPKLAWNTPDQDGKCWYYSNFGNLWCGSQTAPDLPGCALTPGFSPDDVVTAIVNINAGIAQFRKLTRIRGPTPAEDREVETPLATIHGVECTEAGLRFGVQMEREGPGIVLLDYEMTTAEDALVRAEGWRKLGVTYIEKGKWDDAIQCFKNAATFYGEGMDKENRKLMNELAQESEFLKNTNGKVGSPTGSPFRKLGIRVGGPKSPSRSPFASPLASGHGSPMATRPIPPKPASLLH